MGRPSDVAELVRQGKTPTGIAAKLGLSVNTVEGYLHRAVGEGLLRRSDIYFSVAKARRKTDLTLGNWYTNNTCPRVADDPDLCPDGEDGQSETARLAIFSCPSARSP
jgi:hypothetical protein